MRQIKKYIKSLLVSLVLVSIPQTSLATPFPVPPYPHATFTVVDKNGVEQKNALIRVSLGYDGPLEMYNYQYVISQGDFPLLELLPDGYNRKTKVDVVFDENDKTEIGKYSDVFIFSSSSVKYLPSISYRLFSHQFILGSKKVTVYRNNMFIYVIFILFAVIVLVLFAKHRKKIKK